MNPNIIAELLSTVAPIVRIIETAPTQGTAIAQLRGILSSPLVQILEQAAAVFFPQLAPELHLLAMLSGSSFNTTMLIQEGLNIIAKPKPPLKVDGKLGPKTRAAIMGFQDAHGLPSTGFVADAEWAVLQAALANL